MKNKQARIDAFVIAATRIVLGKDDIDMESHRRDSVRDLASDMAAIADQIAQERRETAT